MRLTEVCRVYEPRIIKRVRRARSSSVAGDDNNAYYPSGQGLEQPASPSLGGSSPSHDLGSPLSSEAPAGDHGAPPSPVSLESSTAIVGDSILGELSLFERARMLGVSPTFRRAVYNSLIATKAINGWELVDAGDCVEELLLWLSDKCPNLTAFHVVNPARDEDGEHPMLRGTDKEDVLFPGGDSRESPPHWSFWHACKESNYVLTQLVKLQRTSDSGRHLQSLDLTNCEGVNDKTIQTIGKYCPGLRVLLVGHCPRVRDTGITAVANGCPELRQLSVEYCVQVRSDSIALLTHSRSPHLEELCVMGCPLVRSDALQEVIQHRRQPDGRGGLHRLAASDVSDQVLARIAATCKLLECLDVEGENISDAGIGAVAVAEHLVSFCVRGSRKRTDDGGIRVTDDGIIALAQRRPKLVCLGVPWCRRITDASIRVVARHKDLRHLDVQGCWGVTDASIEDIAETCPELRRLNVAGCTQVTDDGILAVSRKCTKMQRLSVRGCGDVTDCSIRLLGTSCTQLQRLDVNDCNQVTLDSLSVVSDNCLDLQLLVVNTPETREPLKALFKSRGSVCQVR
eukprot:jgi/Mesvir1/29121/Mv18424-RA.1